VGANAKKKTTMAKRNRENKLRERRVEKQARKDARKLAAAHEAERVDSADLHEPLDPDDV
jgi:hypothetical protein